jgi:hypothetical protein
MLRTKAIVRTISAWRDRKVASGATGWATPVRLVQVWTDRELVFVVVRMLGLVQVVVVLVVGMASQFARRSPPRAQYEDGMSRSFEMERRNGP